MSLTPFQAQATTCHVKPGTETDDDSGVIHITDQHFADIVESSEPRMTGNNSLLLDLDVEPATGKGSLRGTFSFHSKTGDGIWEGELEGLISGGTVTAFGAAKGKGAFVGAILRVDFFQVSERDGPHPCDSPKAFFDMEGFILEPR